MTQATYDPFPAADLESNRAGRLTDAQRRGLAGYERGVKKERLMLAAVFAVIAALILISNGRSVSQIERLAIGGAFAGLAILLGLSGSIFTDGLTRDIRDGRVEALEGAIGKDRHYMHSGNSSRTDYYLEVGRRRFEVAMTTYDAAPDAGYVRLYVLPRSSKVVNLERLPDPQVAVPDAAHAPGVVARQLGAMAAGALTGDFERKNEARAQMEAMGTAMASRMGMVEGTPPAEGRDSRPLAEAILGKWQNGLMAVTFASDGTAEATLPGGRTERGHWSVGSDGKLRSDAMGGEAADAWVAGDTLTISDGGRGLAFHRAS